MLDPDSTEWLRSLALDDDAAYARLHALLLRMARTELGRRGGGIAGPERDDLAHQAAADALLAIARKLGEFRGESRFTTWACRFVIFEVSRTLRRHFWRAPDAPLDAGLADRMGADPADESERRELMRALRAAVDEALTERQRRAFVAIALNDRPVEAMVRELGASRNAVYKTVYDARRKLRAELTAAGHLD